MKILYGSCGNSIGVEQLTFFIIKTKSALNGTG